MKSRSVALALALFTLSAAGAIGAHVRAQQLKTDARWLLERGTAQAQEYADTFDSHVADAQLATLDQHRAVLDRAELWQRTEMLSILLAVICAFSTYVLFLFSRLREQLVEAQAPLDEAGAVATQR
jgi:hypothetical protein